MVLAVAALLPQQDRSRPFGFSSDSAAAHLAAERRFLSAPDRDRIRDAHVLLTSRPHPAASARNRELADWIAGQFREASLEDVRVTEHQVLLPRTMETIVEMALPRPWRASLREPAAAGDPDFPLDPPGHAYSASGDVTAPVVYAGEGRPVDYDRLAARGVDVRGRVVLVRQSARYSYRGFKAFAAQQRGAAAILMFSDPAVTGSAHGAPYPRGPWGPDARIERGSIAYDFIVPGDPLTPGWASVAGSRRIPRAEARSLPSIVSVPLSGADARVIVESLNGPDAPAEWQGKLGVTYRIGPGPPIRVRVAAAENVGPVATVTGMLRGSESPEDVVIVGNHRDAWAYGGVDPSSGTAALVELARSLGSLARNGWRPKRSILFASWDAEELALISSTEWGEQHAAWLGARGIAYLNVDSAASGARLVAAASPSLARLVAEAAGDVRDPVQRIPLASIAREMRANLRGVAASVSDRAFVDTRIGGGSDYTVFLNFLGIPVADLAFDGPHGVYHSVYDTHQWVARFGDPGFRYHAALVQLWGLAAMRLANADAVPLDPAGTASAIDTFVTELERRLPPRMRTSTAQTGLADVRAAATLLTQSAASFDLTRSAALDRMDRPALAALNRTAIAFERAFIDASGLPGRPWYRHVVHAPKFTYEPDVLPGLSEAIDANDDKTFAAQCARLAAALRRAADRLRAR